jgi:translocation and assembly module TamA
VRAQPADHLDANGRLPVTFTVSERPLHATGISLAYETNFGPTGRIYWEHRNLFGGAERLRLEAEVTRLGISSDTRDAGYRAGGSLRIPWVLGERLPWIASLVGEDVGLTLDAWALRERLNAYDRDAVTASAVFDRRLTDHLTVQAGLSFEIGQTGRDGVFNPFALIGLPAAVRWDSTDSALDPTRGVRASLAVTPYYEFDRGAVFARVLGTASTYLDLTGEGRSILALRGALGFVPGTGLSDIPLDKRFYAGGGGSVRGFAFQSIGPKTPTGRAEGGASLVEASIEWRQRLWGDIGGVVFLDAGTVGSHATAEFGTLRFGAGVGLRYHTAIGPIRADIAVPLNREPGGAGYGVYIGLGQAF